MNNINFYFIIYSYQFLVDPLALNVAWWWVVGGGCYSVIQETTKAELCFDSTLSMFNLRREFRSETPKQ